LAAHVACAAEVEALAGHLHDGHAGLGRDARDPAPDELVEHHVADDEHAPARIASTSAFARGAMSGTRVRPAPARAGWRRHRGQQQHEHQTPRSREIVFEEPATKTALSAASAPAAAQRGRAARPRHGAPRAAPPGTRRHPPGEEHEPGTPRSRRDLEHVVVQVRLSRVRRLGPLEARVHHLDHARTLPEYRPLHHHVDPACHM
jgi:hypothetical protein